MKLKRGTYVTRKQYQKIYEENKQLKADLETICKHRHLTPESVIVMKKYREIYEFDQMFYKSLKDFATKEKQKNPLLYGQCIHENNMASGKKCNP